MKLQAWWTARDNFVPMQMDALWSQLQQGSSSQTQRASAEKAASGKQPNAAARPTMDWRALCRPVPKAAHITDKDRVGHSGQHCQA